MGHKTWWRLAALTVAAVLVLAGCGREMRPQPSQPPATPAGPTTAATVFAQRISEAVTGDALMAHVTRLQEIADEHGGNRALGTPGYDASVDYVANTLRDKGFDVQTPEFEVRLPYSDEPALTVSGDKVQAFPLEFTIGTKGDGVAGELVPARVEDSPGCTASDYDGLPVKGAIVLVDRGKCQFGDKQAAAAERGAVALVVANNVDGDEMGGTLGPDTDVKIPVIGVTKATGERLRTDPGPATVKLNAGVRVERTRNVVAQTRTGSTSDVVMTGAHLDSVAEGPGINDNGSGVAAVLETALQLGSSPEVKYAVRFGFWGAEELGLLGSKDYVASLDRDALMDLALYLNFDMVASPNPGYFTIDGDQSAPPDPSQQAPRIPEGSAGIERTLVAYLKSAGKNPEDVQFEGRSDFSSFTLAGVAAGGLFTGAEEKMTPEQAERWGGEAGQPFDPNYHKSGDNIDNIDRTAFEINGRGAAYAVALYAQDQSGRNGVPIREDRTRHVLES
ncbi:MAG: M20/M25/M40 family metallo-hydrolase [Mycobacteriaceae bacterium]|nr:M20/M25/M40 family metallo-hydrolase [Mycobacteriaceae bacterium]